MAGAKQFPTHLQHVAKWQSLVYMCHNAISVACNWREASLPLLARREWTSDRLLILGKHLDTIPFVSHFFLTLCTLGKDAIFCSSATPRLWKILPFTQGKTLTFLRSLLGDGLWLPGAMLVGVCLHPHQVVCLGFQIINSVVVGGGRRLDPYGMLLPCNARTIQEVFWKRWMGFITVTVTQRSPTGAWHSSLSNTWPA